MVEQLTPISIAEQCNFDDFKIWNDKVVPFSQQINSDDEKKMQKFLYKVQKFKAFIIRGW